MTKTAMRLLVLALLLLTVYRPRLVMAGADAPLVGIVNSGRAAEWYGPTRWATWTRALTETLHHEGIAYRCVDDEELAAGRLEDYALLILPTNPVITESEAEAVQGFVEHGGRVLAFWETGAYDEGGQLREHNALEQVLCVRTFGLAPARRAQDPVGAGAAASFAYLEATLEGAALFAGLPSLVPVVTTDPVMLAGPTSKAVAMANWLASDRISRPAPQDRNAAVVAAPQALYIGYNLLAAASSGYGEDGAIGPETAGTVTEGTMFAVDTTPLAFEQAWQEAARTQARMLLANAVRTALGTEARQEINSARAALAEAEQALQAARQNLAFVPYEEIDQGLAEARQLLVQAQAKLDAGRPAEARSLATEARYRSALVVSLTQEVRPVGVCAVWIPAGHLASLGGRNGVRYLLDQLESMGINTLFPRVVLEGLCLFWTEVGYRDPAIACWSEDPLRVLVEEAHARGMQVHPCVSVFQVGTQEKTPAILNDHPDWREVSQRGELFAPPSGSSWLSPAHAEVRAYLKRLFLEIVTRYAVDGLHLDYIRYPESTSSIFGYSAASLAAFREKYGIDLQALPPGSTQAALLDEWRRENVTGFVRELAESLRAVRPEVLLSAAVIPEMARARHTAMQDWERWLDEGYVDFVVTMAYSSNERLFERYLNEVDAAAGTDLLVFPGLAVWANSPESLVRQVAMVHARKIPGEAFYATIHFDESRRDALRRSFYREASLSPLADPEGAVAILLANLEAKIDFYQEVGALDEAAAANWRERRSDLIRGWLAMAGSRTQEEAARRFATTKPTVTVGSIDVRQFPPDRHRAEVSLERDLSLAARLLSWAKTLGARLSRPRTE